MQGNYNKLIIPLAIIIAGGIVAWAVLHSGSKPAVNVADMQKQAASYIDSLTIAPVTDLDHIQGSLNAKVTIVEYSDTECPYCKEFHQVLSQIYADYNPVATSTASTKGVKGSSATSSAPVAGNKVAWVYRHFPIADLHTRAPKEAEATECANELGGPAVFWKYLGTIFSTTPSNDGLDPADLLTFADDNGLDKDAFASCLNSGKYTAKINESVAAGAKAGATATPYTVILVRNGSKIEKVPLIDPSGASLGSLPYATMKAIVERLLNS